MAQQSALAHRLLAANRVAVQVLDEAGAEQRTLGERLAEFSGGRETTAVKIAARVDGRPVLGRAELPDAVEYLEPQADRIRQRMAFATARLGRMHR